MGIKGIAYAINDLQVMPPDEEVWSPIAVGVALTARQKRSPYQQLEWRRQVVDACDLDGSGRDWFLYDNTTLTSLTARQPGKLDERRTYTDAICQSVGFRARRGVGNEVVAVFLVNVELFRPEPT